MEILIFVAIVVLSLIIGNYWDWFWGFLSDQVVQFSSLFVSSCSESFSTTFADFLRRNKGEDKKQEK